MIYVDEGAKWFSWCNEICGYKMSKDVRGLIFHHWKPKKVKLKYVLCGEELLRWPE